MSEIYLVTFFSVSCWMLVGQIIANGFVQKAETTTSSFSNL